LRSQYSAPEDDSMVPIGLNNKQMEQLSLGITGLVGTESVEEVAEWYLQQELRPMCAILFLQPLQKYDLKLNLKEKASMKQGL
jgi:hypothetical protein